jgi:GNAT superfamily N-acetyltransferase
MIDAANYDQVETLKNGTKVRIRSIRADDKDRTLEVFRKLKTESIYTRVFHYKKGLSDQDLKRLTEVDFETVVAMVVTVGEGVNEIIIGGGRYVVLDAASPLQSAELAFTVTEDYQGQGIAGSVLRHLAQIAREKGVLQFEAEVLRENKAMLAVFSRSGLPIKKKAEGGTVHVTLSLEGAGA